MMKLSKLVYKFKRTPIYRLFDKIRGKILRRYVKNHYTLSYAGVCALNYMQDVLIGKPVYTQAYEDAITSIQNKGAHTREEAIHIIIAILTAAKQPHLFED